MASGSTGNLRFWRLAERFGPLLALLVLVAVGAFLKEPFRDPVNFQNILWNVAPVGLAAIGMSFVITLGGIDLSVGAAAALLGVAAITAMNRVDPEGSGRWGVMLVAGAVCIAGGGVLGAFNGAMISIGRIAPFIATLATMAAFKSVAQTLANDGTVSPKNEFFALLGTRGIPLAHEGERVSLMIPYPVVAFVVVAVIAHLLLTRTNFGMNVRAIGDNEMAARYGGVAVRRVRFLTYSLCGATAGVGSLMATSYLNSASHSGTGVLWELDAIAAVVIGGTRMSGGVGTIAGTVVGVVMLAVIDNLLVMFDANPALQGLFKGSIIVAAVLLQRGRK